MHNHDHGIESHTHDDAGLVAGDAAQVQDWALGNKMPAPPRWRVRYENEQGGTVFSAIVMVDSIVDAQQFAAQGLHNTQYVDFDNEWVSGPVTKLIIERVQ
jgi:hypothetical protein